ncbi:transposable element Tcb2 transposase [Trichonephila clavipes]|nr:transposable element Tcb2 transposase [Trichonephila clavipes]
MLGSRTDLHIFDAGSVNGTRYCNEILLPYVRLFRGTMGLQFLFMDDNAPCHRTVAAEQLLESEDIERMDWPARSPDLNPIEHVWDFLGRRLAARTLPPVTIRELRLARQDEWAAMPQQLIDTLILSMGRRCETCLAVREIISPTKDRMFLAGHPSQGCFGLQSHCAPCYFFNQASFYPSDFSFTAWWGGFWERLVRTVKELLRRTLGKAIFTYEELPIILCECEKVVNSRRLTYLSEDMQDLTPITPARFLFEIPTADTKDLDVRDANHFRKRLRFRAKVIEELKRRFKNEY